MKTPLTLNAFMDKVGKIKAGAYAHCEFFSEPKTIDGSKIIKVTSAQIRTKIDYESRKDYVEPTYHRTEDSTYLISNSVKRNEKTGNTLFVIYPVWEHTSAKFYEADGVTEIDKETAKARIKPSAPRKDGKPTDILTVNAEKVLDLSQGAEG